MCFEKCWLSCWSSILDHYCWDFTYKQLFQDCYTTTRELSIVSNKLLYYYTWPLSMVSKKNIHTWYGMQSDSYTSCERRHSIIIVLLWRKNAGHISQDFKKLIFKPKSSIKDRNDTARSSVLWCLSHLALRRSSGSPSISWNSPGVDGPPM